MSRGRSSSGQRRRVEEARRVAREALGDAAHPDAPENKYVPMDKPADPAQVNSEGIAVLLIGEAAKRLGISTEEMEAMIAAEKVRTLKVGQWTTVIPESEIVRLKRR